MHVGGAGQGSTDGHGVPVSPRSYHEIFLELQAQAASSRGGHRRPSKARWLFAFIVVVAAGAGTAWFATRDDDSSHQQNADLSTGYLLQEPEFSVRIPKLVRPETISDYSLGITMTAQAWQYVEGDVFLDVFAMQWPTELPADAAAAAFDSVLGGMARRSNGSIDADENFVDSSGVARRRAAISIDGAVILVEGFARGHTVVLISCATSDGTPDYFVTAVESFHFN